MWMSMKGGENVGAYDGLRCSVDVEHVYASGFTKAPKTAACSSQDTG